MPQATRRSTVLGVDDDRANLLALEATLGSQFNLVTARSGPEAIAILESRDDIDVILMDVQMPGMDGFEAAARIKQMPQCADIPIAFITAVYNEDPFIRQGYKVGGVDYFGKPFDPEILKLKLANYASFRQRAALLKERERRGRESEELVDVGRKLAAGLEHLRVGVAIADLAGRIYCATEEFHAISRDLAPPGDAGLLARAAADGGTFRDAMEVRSAFGPPRFIARAASPLEESGGRVTGAVLVVHDLTERRQVERDLQKCINRMVAVEAEP